MGRRELLTNRIELKTYHENRKKQSFTISLLQTCSSGIITYKLQETPFKSINFAVGTNQENQLAITS